jgi:DNA ligase-associated metallophosphoesterase
MPALDLTAGGAPLRLLPERCAFLPAHGLLLVADAHIGKAQSFRRLGVPVPSGTTAGTLARLDAALAASGAGHVVFLGDLLHAARGRSPGTEAAFQRWRDRHPDLALTLVRGNHDRHAGDPPAAWRVRCVDAPWRLPPPGMLALDHHPEPLPGAYVLAGHVHPAVVLGGRAHQRLRLPCFHLGADVGVLPAFGEFTGAHVVQRAPGERVAVVADGDVRLLP